MRFFAVFCLLINGAALGFTAATGSEPSWWSVLNGFWIAYFGAVLIYGEDR